MLELCTFSLSAQETFADHLRGNDSRMRLPKKLEFRISRRRVQVPER